MNARRSLHRPEVIDAIAAWMPSTRWYPLKGREVDVEVAAAYDLGDATILLLRATPVGAPTDEGAGSTLLQVPVAWRAEPGASPIAEVDGGWLVDATADADAVQAFIDVAAGTRAVTGLEGDAPQSPAPAGQIRVVGGEQSNTSIIGGGDAWIAKVFRVVSPGDNPDVVVAGALTRAGCDRVPALVASVRASWPAGDASVGGHLLAVTEFVAGADDAWELYLRHARAALDAPPDDSRAPGADAVDTRPRETSAVDTRAQDARALDTRALDTRALGAAVGRVHHDLARALGSAPASEDDTLRFTAGLEQRLAWARTEAADALADLEPELSDAAERLRGIASIGELQQIHGDLHLGQVLRDAEGGWLLLDFEGEPLRALHERTVREPPLRDVVGMLRSFDYAGGQALRQSPGADAATAAAWVADRQREFLEGYADASDPVDTDDPVLRALMLDKALYEVVYEVRNRPDWLPIPLEAVRALLRPAR